MGRGGSGYQTAVAVHIPEIVDAPSDSAGQTLPSDDVAQSLKFRRAFVAGTGQNEEQLVGMSCKKGAQSLVTQVRAEGDAVDTELVEGVANVAQVGVADVGPFGVQNDRDVGSDFADVTNGLGQDDQTISAAFEVESQVGLVGPNQMLGGVDDGLVEGELLEGEVVEDHALADGRRTVRSTRHGVRHLGIIAVEADAEELAFSPTGLEHLESGHECDSDLSKIDESCG